MADSKEAAVIIEGSLTPAAGYLKRGEQAEVAYTETVQELADGGFINIVANADAYTPIPVNPDKTLPSATPVTPEMPQGVNQDLAQATPVQATDQTIPEVANPEVDNSLVDVNAKPAQAKTTTTSTSTSTTRK
jgi:hypothetical protein